MDVTTANIPLQEAFVCAPLWQLPPHSLRKRGSIGVEWICRQNSFTIALRLTVLLFYFCNCYFWFATSMGAAIKGLQSVESMPVCPLKMFTEKDIGRGKTFVKTSTTHSRSKKATNFPHQALHSPYQIPLTQDCFAHCLVLSTLPDMEAETEKSCASLIAQSYCRWALRFLSSP